MKIISKTYLLFGIVIAVAVVNLVVLYSAQTSVANESYSIIRAGDLKAKVETIAALSGSIANGNEGDRALLQNEIAEFDVVLKAFQDGGQLRGQEVSTIPDEIMPEFRSVQTYWDSYKMDAMEVQASTVYNMEAVQAMNYILEKNTEMTLATDSLVRDLEVLDRNYNRHKEIAAELHETAKVIGQNTLLISIGEDDGAREELRNARLTFEAGMRNLLQEPLDDLDIASLGIENESLDAIPRENSESLNHLDLLWESVELRVRTLESQSLYSEEFRQSFQMLNDKRQSLAESIDFMIDAWNADRLESRDQGQIVTQSIIGIDLLVFAVVLFTVRRSLLPIERITGALSRVKEGFYGEKIEYSSNDEIGQLASTFNTMSETIKEKEEEAKRTDIAKDEFLAMITHELKTPLVPIQGYADMLLGGYLGNLTEKQKERISIIKSSSESLLQLISDLLDVQKLELGQLRMKKEVADINETVANSIRTLQPQIEESNVKIVNDVKPHKVDHDTYRINQVLTNLLKNSLKAIKPGEGVIRVHSEEDATHVKITVEDNGVGIAPDKQGKLFTKFYQADASLTREKGGSGLGLSICKGIVEAHGGRIRLESSSNSGTKVIFSLPKSDSASQS